MSRIGKKLISVPKGVEISIEKQVVTVKGKLGTQSRSFHGGVRIYQEGGNLAVELQNREGSKALWGLSRTLLNNMAVGV